MKNIEKRFLVKLILTLETNHNGCKQEVIQMLKSELGLDVEHNHIREMINQITDEEVDSYLRDKGLCDF